MTTRLKIALRLSEEENVEFPATNSLLVIALSAFSILLILDMLQLVFLRDSWSEHAATLFLSICQMLVLFSQLDQAILQYDLSSSNLAAVSWAFWSRCADRNHYLQRLLREHGLPDGLALSCPSSICRCPPNSISTSVTAVIAFTVIAITHSSSSLVAKVTEGFLHSPSPQSHCVSTDLARR